MGVDGQLGWHIPGCTLAGGSCRYFRREPASVCRSLLCSSFGSVPGAPLTYLYGMYGGMCFDYEIILLGNRGIFIVCWVIRVRGRIFFWRTKNVPGLWIDGEAQAKENTLSFAATRMCVFCKTGQNSKI
jgi:hypothetical protein